ncbi:flagellar motor protein [Acidobacteria bacterium AB60]|nr:flagellar motor protein [Acidobacteria bacterium AB60]
MRSRVPRHRVTHDRWLVSYADFITLLFGFFVVLYAFARADHKQQVQIPVAIDAAFKALGLFPDSSRVPARASSPSGGKDEPAIPMNIVMGDEVLSPARVKEDLEALRRDLTQRLSNQVAQHTVAMKMGRDGLVISLREAGFFDSGSAIPRPETIRTLGQIAAALGRTPYDLRIEGHTDTVPIHTPEFESNWELSAARATHIARTLLELHAISADRVSAAGYAEFHPVDTNATPEGRANNRRVDLVVLPRSAVDFSSPGYSRQTGSWRKITDGD